MIIPKMYDVELTSSNYNPDASTSITITATATDYNGNPVIGESLTIKHNGIAVGNAVITNANGQASVVTTCGSGGTHQFSCKSASCIITVNPYPIGSIYISTNSTDPSTLFGGTWTQIEDRFLLASGSSYALKTNGANTTGGEATHSLTESEMPRHTHIQNEHNHTQNPHHHDLNRRWSNGTGSDGAYAQASNRSYQSIQTKDTTATNKATTATNKYTGGNTSIGESAGNGVAHNNMPPYLVVSVWERTA